MNFMTPTATDTARPAVVVAHAADPSIRAIYSQQLASRADVRFLADLGGADRTTRLQEARVLVTFSPDRELGPSELEALARTPFVQCLAAGRDRFPFELFATGAVAFNPGAAAGPIAEHALAMVLAAAKNLMPRQRQLALGVFNQSEMNMRLDGGTAAVLGLGAIGSRVARLLQAFGMKVHGVNRSGHTRHLVDSCVSLENLDAALDQADVFVIAAELNAQTENAVGERQLRLLKPDAILVNVSRAALVQQAALFSHLKQNPGFRACLDVWWTEPMHAGRFALDYPFLDLPNILGSPHNSPMVPGIFADLALAAARNVARFLDGEAPLHLGSSRM